MQQQVASTDLRERKRLFSRVQRIFAEELPAIYFVAPRISLAASARVTGIRPACCSRYPVGRRDAWRDASLT